MSSTLTIDCLARHQQLIPLVEQWFVSEWPSWYGVDGPGNIRPDLEAFAASEVALPIGFIAFNDGQAVGAGALKAASIPTHDHLTPWAAAGYVVPAYRGRGIGAALLAAMVSHAQALGFPRIYCGTSTAESLLRRCGWSSLALIQHAGKPLTIFSSAA